MSNPTALRRLSFYIASPVETCDECSAAIKMVACVEYKDGTRAKYGSKCIEKILKQDNSLLALYRKNSKRLKKHQEWLEIISRPYDQIPALHNYYGRGYWMITDEDGKTIDGAGGGCALFHPTKIDAHAIAKMDGRETFDMRPYGDCWEPHTLENTVIKFHNALQQAIAWHTMEIERLEGFLARILSKFPEFQKDVA